MEDKDLQSGFGLQLMALLTSPNRKPVERCLPSTDPQGPPFADVAKGQMGQLTARRSQRLLNALPVVPFHLRVLAGV